MQRNIQPLCLSTSNWNCCIAQACYLSTVSAECANIWESEFFFGILFLVSRTYDTSVPSMIGSQHIWFPASSSQILESRKLNDNTNVPLDLEGPWVKQSEQTFFGIERDTVGTVILYCCVEHIPVGVWCLFPVCHATRTPIVLLQVPAVFAACLTAIKLNYNTITYRMILGVLGSHRQSTRNWTKVEKCTKARFVDIFYQNRAHIRTFYFWTDNWRIKYLHISFVSNAHAKKCSE